MQRVTGESQALSRDPESAGDGTRGTGGRLRRLNPSLAALITWVVCLPVAFAAATLGPADPFRLRVAMVPVVVLVAGVIVVGVASRRLPADLASGIGAGLFGGWVAFTLRTALHGTPFGFGGLGSDAGRLAAMANRYAGTWHSSDGIVPSVPSNYPPLFPWLVGRTSALVHVPAWRLLGPAEAIALSFAVVAGYLLWRRLLPGPLALAVTLPVLLCYSLPEKAYEILALAVFVPWAVATFGEPPRGRLHWLPAGLIGGLSILLYWAFIVFGALGVLALAVLTWRASPDRARYVRHVALTIVVALVVASWYLIPYLGWGLLHGSSQVEYQYQGGGIQDSPLSVPVPDTAGRPGTDRRYRADLVAGPGVVGETAAAADRRRLRLLAARPGILRPGQPTPAAARHAPADRPGAGGGGGADHRAGRPRRRAPALHPDRPGRAAGPRPVPAGHLDRRHRMAGVDAGRPRLADRAVSAPVNSQRNDTTAAFTTALPGGSYPHATPASIRNPWFPTDPIQKDVASVLGASAAPVTLSASEQPFAYVNWPGYIGVTWGAAGIDTDWPARYAALEKLSRVTDPAAFAAASARTAFGPVDVFILQRSGPARWTWQPAGSPDPAITFTPAQFSPDAFTVFTNLPGNYVLAVRQPPRNG